MARRHAFAGKVLVLVTVPALERIEASAVGSALHVLKMRVTVLALQRNVSRGMAIHAARMHEYRIRGKKGGARSCLATRRRNVGRLACARASSRQQSGLIVPTTPGEQE